MGCLFTLLIVSFAVKLFSLIKSHLFIFTLVAFAFGLLVMNSLPKPMSRREFLMLSSRIFMGSGVRFKTLIILIWFLYKIRDEDSVSLLLVVGQLSQHPLLNRVFFPHFMFLFLC